MWQALVADVLRHATGGGLGGTMSQGTASMRRAAADVDMDEGSE
jgi:hypothetical protein